MPDNQQPLPIREVPTIAQSITGILEQLRSSPVADKVPILLLGIIRVLTTYHLLLPEMVVPRILTVNQLLFMLYQLLHLRLNRLFVLVKVLQLLTPVHLETALHLRGISVADKF